MYYPISHTGLEVLSFGGFIFREAWPFSFREGTVVGWKLLKECHGEIDPGDSVPHCGKLTCAGGGYSTEGVIIRRCNKVPHGGQHYRCVCGGGGAESPAIIWAPRPVATLTRMLPCNPRPGVDFTRS